MNLDEIESDHMLAPDYSSDHEYDRDGVIWSMENFLSEFCSSMDTAPLSMVERANEMTANMADSTGYPKDFLNPGDRVISFNYTFTLERLFENPRRLPDFPHPRPCGEGRATHLRVWRTLRR